MRVINFQIENCGIHFSDYFQGVDVRDWDAVFVGIGNDFAEALESALEQAADSGYEVPLTEEEQETLVAEDNSATVAEYQEYYEDENQEDDEDNILDVETPWLHVAVYVEVDKEIEDLLAKISRLEAEVERLKQERKTEVQQAYLAGMQSARMEEELFEN